MNEAYNMDCMEYMKTLPDNAFDLAVVDPPYGGGLTEGGGCKGWFTKYHQDTCSQSVNAERERSGSGITVSGVQEADSRSTKRHHTFGMRKCRKNYQKIREDENRKKSSLGTLPLEKYILKSFSAFPSIRLYGAATTLNFLRRDVSLYGRS